MSYVLFEPTLPNLLAASLIVQVVYMILWFVAAHRKRRIGAANLVWSGGLVLSAWMIVAEQPTVRTYMAAAMVSVWSGWQMFRLVQRSRQAHNDRYYEVKADGWKRPWRRAFLTLYLGRAVTAWLVGLPLVTNAGIALPGLRLLFTAGYVVWALGFYLEYRADSEYDRFYAEPKQADKLLDDGLWRYSRHPDLLGEVLQWIGIGLLASQTSFGWLGLVGPLLYWYRLANFTIPVIESGWPDTKRFREYRQTVGSIIPRFRS